MSDLGRSVPDGLPMNGAEVSPSSPPSVGIPSAATFPIGVYDDGSAPVVRVYYDVTSEYTPDQIWVDAGECSDTWCAFPWQHAKDVCAAIMAAASAIEAQRAATPKSDAVHESAVPPSAGDAQ